jgi:outer membrane protein assembly factor BamB
LQGPIDVAVSDGWVYFTEQWEGRLSKVSTNGGTVIVLLTGLDDPFGIAISEGHVYLAERGAGEIKKYTLES